MIRSFTSHLPFLNDIVFNFRKISFLFSLFFSHYFPDWLECSGVACATLDKNEIREESWGHAFVLFAIEFWKRASQQVHLPSTRDVRVDHAARLYPLRSSRKRRGNERKKQASQIWEETSTKLRRQEDLYSVVVGHAGFPR